MKVKLGDVCERGSSNLKQSDIVDCVGDYPIYGASGLIGKVDFYHQNKPYVALVKDGAGIGRTSLHPAKSSIIGTMQYLLPKENVLPEYLYYVVRYMHLEKYFSGATIPHIYFRDYKDEEFNLDTLEKQAEIVKTLSKCESVIAARTKELQKLDELIKARFVELFGDPIRSDKYNTKKLSTCVKDKGDMVDGPFGSQVNTKVDYIENGEIPVIRTVNVKMMSFSPADLKYMTREKYETVIRSQVLPGDVILTKVGTIGNVCVFPDTFEEAVLSTTGSCRIRVDKDVMDTVFFAYNLMYLKDKLLEIASAGVQPFLNMSHVKNIDILDVPLDKQMEFTDFVKQVDKSKVAVQKALDETQTLFDSLMQEYFE